MRRDTPLKSVYGATFAASGTSVFIFGRPHVRRYDLTPRKDRAPSVTKVWSVLVSHASAAVLSQDDAVVVIADTSGRIFGLNAVDGAKLWTTNKFGEGAMTRLPDGSVLFMSWQGRVVRLDPLTGGILTDAPIGHRSFHPQNNDTLGLLYFRIDLPSGPHDPLHPILCRLNPHDMAHEELRDDINDRHFSLSPDGQNFVEMRRVRIADWESRAENTADLLLRVFATGTITARRRIGYRAIQNGWNGAWSSDGRMIVQPVESGFVFRDGADLAPVAHLPSRYACGVVFSSAGDLVLCCDFQASVLLRTADLHHFPCDAAIGA